MRAWGWDVAPDGAPGDTAKDELEACTTSCKAGVDGSGAGQITIPWSIAFDAEGNLYVAEARVNIFDPSKETSRVQKFSPQGEFSLMWGGEVNKTTGADVCTKADLEGGDECGRGVPRAADGWFASAAPTAIAHNPATDTILVGDQGRVQEFDTDGNFIGSIDLSAEFLGERVIALDTDSAGSLYVAFLEAEDVHKLNAVGAPVAPSFGVEKPRAVAVDAGGNVYASEGGKYVLGFQPSGAAIDGMEHEDEFGDADPDLPQLAGVNDISGLATNVLGPGSSEPGDLYVARSAPGASLVRVYGPPPILFEPPPKRPPEIDAQYALAVDSEGATLRSHINPWRGSSRPPTHVARTLPATPRATTR